MELLDYSQGSLTGTQIRQAGYAGTIRYITSPDLAVYVGSGRAGNPKHITPAEYASHKAAGLVSYFVYQGNTTDADGGRSMGVANAQKALAGLRWIGAPVDSPVFFTNDRTTLPGASAWQAYLDGARTVLGRVGAYGFKNAILAARGHADWYWQSGRESDVVPGLTNVYQWNNGAVYLAGLKCDINRVKIPIQVQTTEEDMTKEEHDLLKEVAARLRSIHTKGFAEVGLDEPRSMAGDLSWFQDQLAGSELAKAVARQSVAVVDIPALVAGLQSAGVAGLTVEQLKAVINSARLTV